MRDKGKASLMKIGGSYIYLKPMAKGTMRTPTYCWPISPNLDCDVQ